ncbi:MAG: hypothetical protein ACREV4_14280 [Gammaproteobacteria bacterium]
MPWWITSGDPSIIGAWEGDGDSVVPMSFVAAGIVAILLLLGVGAFLWRRARMKQIKGNPDPQELRPPAPNLYE